MTTGKSTDLYGPIDKESRTERGKEIAISVSVRRSALKAYPWFARSDGLRVEGVIS